VARIINPSFEEETDGIMPNGGSTSSNPDWGMPDEWSWRMVGAMNGHGTKGALSHATDGIWDLELFAVTDTSHYDGDYLEFYQAVMLTDIKTISFDYYLGTHTHCQAYFSVGSQILWTGTSGSGTANVDVSSIVGLNEIALGVEVLEDYSDGGSADGRTWFDNLDRSPDIPTLSEWSLIFLTMLLVVGGMLFIRNRRRAEEI
jgi:hypothetical protein